MTYWLRDWMSVEGIRSTGEAKKVINDRAAFSRLVIAAEQYSSLGVMAAEAESNVLVAGATMDLTGHYKCQNPACLMESADQLIRQTWHSFERVMVTGLDSQQFLMTFSGSRARAKQLAIDHIELAIYLESINGFDILEFTNRPRFCKEHLDQHAAEAGLMNSTSMRDALVELLRRETRIESSSFSKGRLKYSITTPLSSAITHGQLSKKGAKEPPSDELLLDILSWGTANEYVAETIGSVALAKMNHASLGEVGYGPIRFIEPTPLETQVALSLELPMLEGVPTSEITHAMRTQPDEVKAFRFALRRVMSEHISAAEYPTPSEIARNISSKSLEPEILELQRAAKAAASTFSLRSMAAVGIGGVLTTIGLLAFAPIVVPGVVIAAGGVLASQHDYLKDRKSIKLSELHFLWRTAQQRG